MITEQKLIDAIRLHAPSHLPDDVDAATVLTELKISDSNDLENALNHLQDRGYLTYQYGNNKIKFISLNTSFPL